MLTQIYIVRFYSSKLVHFFKKTFREKQISSFTLPDKWNVNNYIEKVEVYFSVVFYDED